MTDFLGHLADRVLHRAPVVKPRLLSAFEPSALNTISLATAFRSEAPDLAPAEQSPEVVDPQELSNTGAQIQPPVQSVFSGPDRDEPRPQLEHPAPNSPPFREHLPRQPNLFVAKHSPLPTSAGVEPQNPGPPVSQSADTSSRALSSRDQVSRDAFLLGVHAEDSARRAAQTPLQSMTQIRPASLHAQDEPTRAVSPSDETAARWLALAAARAKDRVLEDRVPARVAAPRLQPAPARDSITAARLCPASSPETGSRLSASQKSDPAPSIRVTIGRIEVRAAPAAQPIQRQPRPSKAMSLGEYLARRNGGPRQ